MSAMCVTSDIPDWCFYEAGTVDSLDAKSLQQMFHCSPVSKADFICTPCLLLLGGKDLRVPPSQVRLSLKLRFTI